MKILRKWLLNWVQKARDESNKEAEQPMPVNYSTMGSANFAIAKEDVPFRMSFNVMPAAGGVVISINNYDRKNGRHTENLHVIHDDEDVATNIGHIVSMELLRSQ